MSTAEGASGEARVRWLVVGAFTPSPAGKRVLTRGRAQRVQSLAATLASLTPDELAAIARGAELIERVSRGPAGG